FAAVHASYLSYLFCFSFSIQQHDLLSFPTRRSSDLLKNLHILHDYGYLSLNVEQLRPVLARLEMFTLVQYTHGNRLELLRCLTPDRKSTRLNSSHVSISYAVFCLKKKNKVEHTYVHG